MRRLREEEEREEGRLTVISFQELDKGIIEPQSVLFSDIIEEVFILCHLEYVRSYAPESRVFA